MLISVRFHFVVKSTAQSLIRPLKIPTHKQFSKRQMERVQCMSILYRCIQCEIRWHGHHHYHRENLFGSLKCAIIFQVGKK